MESATNQKKLQDETKLEAGLNASLELQCRETVEIRTKHVRAGFQASLEGLKAVEIGAKQYDKEGSFLGASKSKKKRAKMGLPSSRFQPQLLPGRIRRLKRTVPFTFRRLEGGLQGGASRGFQALLKRASRGLEGGFTFVKPSRA